VPCGCKSNARAWAARKGASDTALPFVGRGGAFTANRLPHGL